MDVQHDYKTHLRPTVLPLPIVRLNHRQQRGLEHGRLHLLQKPLPMHLFG